MGELIRRIRKSSFFSAVIWTILGLLLLVWPGISARIFCYIMGAVLLVQGLSQAVPLLRAKDWNGSSIMGLIVSLVITVVGAWAILQPDTAKLLIPVLLSVIILVHGVVDLSFALRLKREEIPSWKLVLIFGLITLLAAVLIFLKPGFFADFVFILTGACLIFDGVTEFWIWHILSKMTESADEIESDSYHVK